MLKTQTIIIPKQEAQEMQDILDIIEGYCEDYKEIETIKTYTVKFDNDIEVDVKVCNGDTPYVDAVLFDNGCEVAVCEVSDTLLGEYWFEYGENRYEVFIKQSE